ncbi:MAG: hypothetical protein IKA87_00050 [Lentisphaeria bacterium]|nr:hypothetical protein [Lentisphaeria bacterium]
MLKKQIKQVLLAAGLSFSVLDAGVVNLLKNPGFEDPKNWTAHWKIENLKKTIKPYHYRLDAKGGGHDNATQHTGKNAIELYCDGNCKTKMSQQVSLKPGKYRFGIYARNNGASHQPQFEISAGNKKDTFYVITSKYRFYYLDFEVKTSSKVEVSIIPREGGMAFDDAIVEPLANAKEQPYLFLDLYPVTPWGNVRHFFSGQLQWIDFALTCIDRKRYSGAGTMRIVCPEDVLIEGINIPLLNRWKPRKVAGEIKLLRKPVVRNGKKCIEYCFNMPVFHNYSRPQDFGGFWVRPTTDAERELLIQLEDKGKVIHSIKVTLKALKQPVNMIPSRLVSMCYHVQWWRQSLAQRLEAIPPQLLTMGFNVWTDYMVLPGNNFKKPTSDETVMLKAYKDYNIKNFYFTYSQLYELRHHYPDLSNKTGEKNVYGIDARGKRMKQYNMRFIASNGKAWRDSALNYWYELAKRPDVIGLPPYAGVINNAQESMSISYDPATLAEFAAERNLPLKEMTVANLQGKYKTQWMMYNQRLFNKICVLWAKKMREAVPGIKTANSLGPFGPNNSRMLLPETRIAWAQQYYDYKMPQLYHRAGSGYLNRLNNGINAKLYGKANGYADMLPIMLVSMGEVLHDLKHMRFMAIDILTNSKHIKGLAYYMGQYAFADAKIMLEISKINTLVAKLEDYFIDGQRADNLSSFSSTVKNKKVRTMDEAGYSTMAKIKVTTQTKLHLLNRNGRVALVTVFSRSWPPVVKYGDEGFVKFNLAKLLPGKNRADYRIIDWISGKIHPCVPQLPLNTRDGHLGVFEIVRTDVAKGLLSQGKLQPYKK